MSINGQDFPIEEATITAIHQAFSEKTLTCTQLTDFYLDRIQTLNPILRAVIEVNPDAHSTAIKIDSEIEESIQNGRKLTGLIGIPVLLKDSIATKDKTSTTAGSYALVGSVVASDATVVERLRKSGAVIMGKASMSEWYRLRSIDYLPNGWCARSGQAVNAYVKSADPFGSSTGSAISVAANMVAVSIGTDTHGSIICPSHGNCVVGFRPTVGLVSRAGVMPISSCQDSVGTVSDCVYVLDEIVGPDIRDKEATTKASKYIPEGGYKQFLKEDGLTGKRLGVVRNPFVNSLNEYVAHIFEQHLQTLREKGAIIVDNLEMSNINEIINPHQSGEIKAMLSDFKHEIVGYFNELESSPVKSIADIIAFNNNNPELEKMNEYPQDGFIKAENMHNNEEEIKKIVENLKKLCKEGFEKMMKENELDAMVTPGIKAYPVITIGGYPGIIIPGGYDEHRVPFGILFSGLTGMEPKLIEIGYGFEQATLVRKPPLFDSPKWHEDLPSQ